MHDVALGREPPAGEPFYVGSFRSNFKGRVQSLGRVVNMDSLSSLLDAASRRYVLAPCFQKTPAACTSTSTLTQSFQSNRGAAGSGPVIAVTPAG